MAAHHRRRIKCTCGQNSHHRAEPPMLKLTGARLFRLYSPPSESMSAILYPYSISPAPEPITLVTNLAGIETMTTIDVEVPPRRRAPPPSHPRRHPNLLQP
nr:unnamed protein product [Digitaria exilis]